MSDISEEKKHFLELGQHSKRRISKVAGVTKTITEFLSEAVEKARSLEFPDAIKAAVPWAEPVVGAAAETVGDVLPPVKFLVKVAQKITEITDPEELGRLVCTIAFERAAEQAIGVVGSPVEEKHAVREVKEQLALIEPSEDVDLGAFSYENALEHEFFKRAELNLQTALLMVGYSGPQVDRITNEVKDRFVVCLRTILANGDTADKFAPFKEYVDLGGAKERQAYRALAEHARYQRWLFEESPVLGKSPFALQHIYVDTDCGRLTWGQINPGEKRPGLKGITEILNQVPVIDPFDEQFGERESLLKTVMKLIGDPQYKEPIIIQGAAGSGKSSLTLRLCDVLMRLELRPIRVRCKDLRFDKHIKEALPQAVKLSDEQRSPDGVAPTPEDLFRQGSIFRESGSGKYSKICRYVLILDGWDEISVSNEGFRRRIVQMLEQLRNEYLDNPTLPLPVRVILTGRPSSDVTDSGFLRDRTAILTIRPLAPFQLQEFVRKIHSTLKAPPLHPTGEDVWPEFTLEQFAPILRRYTTEFEDPRLSYRSHARQYKSLYSTGGSLGVLGLPLLAQLAVRLISVWQEDPAKLVENPTTLYRNLVNLTCEKGGKAEADQDAADEIRTQSRIMGYELRSLLWKTAAAMTVYGKDLIPYDELSKRLNLEGQELDEQVASATGHQSLSALLISFYFKGGVRHLGCEFVHKSFREYLFAEAIVDALKRFAGTVGDDLIEREKYWKDFTDDDPRHNFSREIAQLLGPQWISPEVVSHLTQLIRWEINRAIGEASIREAGTATEEATIDDWIKIRDGLADLWDWWAEGVHLRSQPHRGTRRELTYSSPYITELIEYALPFDSSSIEIPPARTTTLDAHLGDGIFTLCVLVHDTLLGVDTNEIDTSVSENSGSLTLQQTRRYQSNHQGIRFAPSGQDRRYFGNYISRINSAGWRPYGAFPSYTNLSGVDLSSTDLKYHSFINVDLSGATLNNTDLSGANLRGAALEDASLDGASLSSAQLSHASLEGASLQRADLRMASLRDVNLHSAVLVGANLKGADLTQSVLSVVDLRDGKVTGANLIAVDLEHANLDDARFDRAILDRANLSGASLERTRLNQASLYQTNLTDLDLSTTMGLKMTQLEFAITGEGTKLPPIQLELLGPNALGKPMTRKYLPEDDDTWEEFEEYEAHDD